MMVTYLLKLTFFYGNYLCGNRESIVLLGKHYSHIEGVIGTNLIIFADMNGKLVISLDFELYWGVRDIIKLENYKTNLMGVRKAIPMMLESMKAFDIKATFATVGLLFFSTKDELLRYLPNLKPTYNNPEFSPYPKLESEVGIDEVLDPFHFGYDLINQIKAYGQEIGSHSFCHYYCIEQGQSVDQFQADVDAAIRVALDKGIELRSFVFPRNQFNPEYIPILERAGFTSFRGNQKEFMYNYYFHKRLVPIQRILRLLDSYINISGYNTLALKPIVPVDILNIPSSRLLRPYSARLSFLENLRFKRIAGSMTHAAKNNRVYHLWWHPHNFGINSEENIRFLNKIFHHYSFLNKKYGFESVSMQELSEEIRIVHNNGRIQERI